MRFDPPTSDLKRRLRRWTGHALALSFGIAVAVVLLEIAVRVLDLAPSAGISTVTRAEFERVPGLFSPGQEVVDRRVPALPHHVKIDARGYRATGAAADARKRIFMVGDSFTFGDFVDDAESLPAQVQRALTESCGPVEVINAGVGGTTIITHANLVKRAAPLRPDLVLLVFSENDVHDLAIPQWDLLARNREMKSRPPLSLVYPLLKRTALWHLMLDLRARWTLRRAEAERAAGDAAGEDATPGGPLPTEGAGRRTADDPPRFREQYASAFRTLARDLAARNLPFAVALYPSHWTVYGDMPPTRLEWVAELARGEGVEAIHLLEPLQASGLERTEQFLLPHDGHPSPRGHRIAADYLAARLAALPALAEICPAETEPVSEVP